MILTGLTACSRTPNGPSLHTGREVSNDHLRNAMQSLTSGDDQMAEQELKSSLAADPTNERARTNLASVYAKRAGVSLTEWITILKDGADTLKSKKADLRKTSKLFTSLQKKADDIAQGDTSDLLNQAEFSKTMAAISKISLNIQTILDVFQDAKLLSAEQMSQLDLAIDLLRDGEPAQRSEESRLYLSVLSIVRLVNTTRVLVGRGQIALGELDRAAVCDVGSEDLRIRLENVKRSLSYLAEGLVTVSSDGSSKERHAREKIRDSIQEILEADLWGQLDALFNADSKDGQAFREGVNLVCSNLPAVGGEVLVEIQSLLDSAERSARDLLRNAN